MSVNADIGTRFMSLKLAVTKTREMLEPHASIPVQETA